MADSDFEAPSDSSSYHVGSDVSRSLSGPTNSDLSVNQISEEDVSEFINPTRAQFLAVMEEKSELLEDLEVMERERVKLRRTVDLLRGENEELKKERDELADIVDIQDGEKQDLDIELRETEKDLEEYNAMLEQASGKIKKLEKKGEEDKEKLKEMGDKLRVLEEEVKNNKKRKRSWISWLGL